VNVPAGQQPAAPGDVPVYVPLTAGPDNDPDPEIATEHGADVVPVNVKEVPLTVPCRLAIPRSAEKEHSL
jgi:hypothetical protein